MGRAWTRKDVCWFLQICDTSLTSVRTRHPSFPEPVILLDGTFRWSPKAIAAWFDSMAGVGPDTATVPTPAARRFVPKPATTSRPRNG